MSYTQVVSVAPATVSGLEIYDNTKVLFEEVPPVDKGLIHKVDNGLVYMIDGAINDISFQKIPPQLAPSVGQSLFQWFVDRYSKGISNSALKSVDGSAYFKTIVAGRMAYSPACDHLRPNTKPWILLSDLDTELFRHYDSVKLYNSMAKRGFSAGQYEVDYIDAEGEQNIATGFVMALPLTATDISPTYYLGESGYSFSLCIKSNQTSELFFAPNWIKTSDNALGATPGLAPSIVPSFDLDLSSFSRAPSPNSINSSRYRLGAIY